MEALGRCRNHQILGGQITDEEAISTGDHLGAGIASREPDLEGMIIKGHKLAALRGDGSIAGREACEIGEETDGWITRVYLATADHLERGKRDQGDLIMGDSGGSQIS
jgi:hypothetical protein